MPNVVVGPGRRAVHIPRLGFLAADEDFNPYRADQFFVGDALRPAAEVPGGLSVASLSDQTLTGKVVDGGYDCPQAPNVDAEIPKARLHRRGARAPGR